MAKAKKVKLYPCHCNQCGYKWNSKKKKPLHCAACISDKWSKPLIGAKLRKPVASRLTRGSKKKVGKGKGKAKVAAKRLAAPKKARVMKGKAVTGSKPSTKPVKVGSLQLVEKKPRAPRVKKEKGIPAPVAVEQVDGE
jgi:hypothetical protein